MSEEEKLGQNLGQGTGDTDLKKTRLNTSVLNEILRLFFHEKMSLRDIEERTGISKSTLGRLLKGIDPSEGPDIKDNSAGPPVLESETSLDASRVATPPNWTYHSCA